jgi:serine/threonine-protein kinase
VGIYHKGVFDEMTYLVIEYVNGPTLSQIIRMVFKQGGRMDYRALLTITSSVTSALDYAHARGVIHRDIKPSNIMSDRNGNVFLTDFGLALRMVDGTEGKAFGSPYYIAPEQVNNSADASPRSDLYSLGVVIFRLLTGRLPFESRKPMHVVMMHISEPAPPVSEYNLALPKAVDSVLLKCLAKKPEERYHTGAELQRALATSLGLEDMAEPIYQPRFLASTWTRILDKDTEPTYASATHLLEDVQSGALDRETSGEDWTDADEGAPLDD